MAIYSYLSNYLSMYLYIYIHIYTYIGLTHTLEARRLVGVACSALTCGKTLTRELAELSGKVRPESELSYSTSKA